MSYSDKKAVNCSPLPFDLLAVYAMYQSRVQSR